MLITKILEDKITASDYREQIKYLTDVHDELATGEICHCDICQIVVPLLSYAAAEAEELAELRPLLDANIHVVARQTVRATKLEQENDRLRHDLARITTDHNGEAELSARLQAENERLREALSIYADKSNWTDEARASVLTGNVNADGDEEEIQASLSMGDDWVFDYDDQPGWTVANTALNES